MKRLCTGEREILRRIFGPVVEEGIWRIGTNQELRELYKDLDVADIKKKGLELIGHVARIVREKRIFWSKMKGSRRTGRPRLRWLEDVEEVLCEMKVKR